MRWAILDTNIYIAAWLRGDVDGILSDVRSSFIVRHSAVVLSELRRGTRMRDAERRVSALARRAKPIWAPTADDWWDAGRLIQQIGDRLAWDRARRRAFQNDALIALTARRHGATVVTNNAADFVLLRKTIRFALITA